MARKISVFFAIILSLASLLIAHPHYKPYEAAHERHEFKTFDRHTSHERQIPGHPRIHHPHRGQNELGATIVDVANIVVGLFEGVGVKTNLNEITGCIEDTQTIWDDVKLAVDDFKTFDYTHIKDGLAEIGKAVYLLPTDVKACESIPSDITKLEDMSKIFLHPRELVVQVAEAIWVNGVDILTELHKAVDDYSEDKFYDMGYQIGTALATVFFKGNQVMNEQSIATFNGAAQDAIDIAEFIGGLVKGVAIEASLGDITTCIQDATLAMGDLKRAYQDFQEKTVSGVEAGLKEIGTLIKLIPSAVSTCEAIPEDIQKLINMASVFTNPITLVYTVAKNLIVNGVEIFDEVSHGVVDYDEAKYFDSGYYFGEALANVFLKGSYNYRNHLGAETVQDVAEVILGFLEGVSIEEKLDNLDECLVDGDQIWQLVEDANVQCQAKTFSGAKKCIEDIGSIAKELPSALKECKNAPADLSKLEDMCKVFLNPISLSYNIGKALIVDGTNIYHEISDSVTQFEGANYEAFGKDLGLALSEVFLGKQAKIESTAVDVGEFILGLIQGVAIESKLTNIATCLTDAQSIESYLQQAIADFEKGSISGIAAGLKEIGEAGKLVPGAVKACENVPADITKIAEMASIFVHPLQLIIKVGESILMNGVEIYRDVRTSVTDYENKDYFHSGEFGGEAFALVFFTGMQNYVPEVQNVEKDLEIAAEIMFGFLDGVSIKADLTDIKECIEDPQVMVADFSAAFQDLKQFWSFSHLRKAFAEIGEGIGKIKDTIHYCPKIGTDISKLETMAKIFQNPEVLVIHIGQEIIFNGKEIYHEVSEAVTDYEAKKYYDFGKFVGEASAQLTIVQDSTRQVKMIKDERNVGMNQFLEGLFLSVFTDRELGDKEKVLEWLHNLSNSFEEQFETMYLASWLSMNSKIETDKVYQTTLEAFSTTLVGIMAQMKQMVDFKDTATALHIILNFQLATPEYRNAELDELSMKMMELFAEQQFSQAGSLFAHLLEAHMNALA